MDVSSDVTFALEDGVGVITLNRPAKLNAMTTPIRTRLGECLDAAANDPSVQAVLIRAAGRAFCAGADLSDRPSTPLGWRERILLAQAHHMQIVRMQKPVIAAVQGVAVGGGASLALAADILVMAESAKLVFPFVRLGVVPDGGAAALLQAKTSPAVALDVLLSGGEIPSAEALRLGLTRRVVSDDALEHESVSLARQLVSLPREALMLTKALISQYWTPHLMGALTHEADAFALATTTAGHQAALEKMTRRLSQ